MSLELSTKVAPITRAGAKTLSCDTGPDFQPTLHTIRDKMLMERSANLLRSISLMVASSVFLFNRNAGVRDVRAL